MIILKSPKLELESSIFRTLHGNKAALKVSPSLRSARGCGLLQFQHFPLRPQRWLSRLSTRTRRVLLPDRCGPRARSRARRTSTVYSSVRGRDCGAAPAFPHSLWNTTDRKTDHRGEKPRPQGLSCSGVTQTDPRKTREP